MSSNRYRFIIGASLFVAGTINYMDRAAIGIVAPMLSKDFSLSPSSMGFVFGVFGIGYALFAFVGGQLADKYGPRRVYIWAASSWSLFCGLTGIVTGFAQLLIVRSLFGFAEGPMNPTSFRAIANWFPRQETSRAIGVVWSGQSLGAVITGPIVGMLAIHYGWRFAFIATCLLGFLWVAVWRAIATDHPHENPRVTPEEIAYIESNRTIQTVTHEDGRDPLRGYLTHSCTLSLGLGFFAIGYALYIFLAWLPSYLTNILHMEIRQMVFVSAIPWACGFIGYLGGGFVSDYIYEKMSNKLAARKITAFAPLGIGAAALLLVVLTTNATYAVALIAIAVAVLTASQQSCWAIIREVIPERRTAAVGGFIHMIGNVSGVVGPSITGIVVQYFGGFNNAFIIAASLSFAAIAMMWVFVRPLVQTSPLLSAA